MGGDGADGAQGVAGGVTGGVAGGVTGTDGGTNGTNGTNGGIFPNGDSSQSPGLAGGTTAYPGTSTQYDPTPTGLRPWC